MKITMMVGMVVLGGMAAAEGQAGTEGDQNLTVYLENYAIVPQRTFSGAKALATNMFAGIGVRIRWRTAQPAVSQVQREGAIVVRMATDTPEAFMPGARAFALPYEGVHITVFFDRLTWSARQGGLPALLAHVLVHEITHMLQGLSRHSDSGIMRAYWTKDDYYGMLRKPLPFTPQDVELIHRGLEQRPREGTHRYVTSLRPANSILATDNPSARRLPPSQ
jgi:hypothetical protein